MKKAPFNIRIDLSYVLDIETTMNWQEIRMVGMQNTITGVNRTVTTVGDLRHVLQTINDRKATIITWNGTRFDWDILNKVWGINKSDYPDIAHVDGMLLAKILYPNEPSYSLAAFGKKFKCKVTKGEVDYDNAHLTELCTYLIKDLKLTAEVVQAMYADSDGSSHRPRAIQRALDLETKVAALCQEQVNKKVRIDATKATELLTEIRAKMVMIEDDLANELPEWPLPPSKLHHPPKNQFKMDGTPNAHITNYCLRYGYGLVYDSAHKTYYASKKGSGSKNLPLTKPLQTHAKLELSNQAAIKEWLMKKGWKPTIWNTKRDPATGKNINSSPRLTDKQTKEPCPNLKAIGTTFGADISDWLTLRSRKNVIMSDNGTGWLHKMELAEDGIHYVLPSDADTLGANTARWTHKIIANIPRVKSAYGKQMRELFCARQGKTWVGWDASSLEACMEAHYVYPYSTVAAEELMDGDPHTKNLHAITPLTDRDHAKTLKYGITYGAQAAKVASILNVPKSEGQMWFDKFWDANPALAQLREDTIHEAGGGSIVAIDGRNIGIRSKHSCLNAKFQSAGAIVMKYAMVIADKMIKAKFGDQAYGLIRYHDEEIWECDSEEIAHEVGKIGCESIRMAGKYLRLNVELDADYSVGQDWSKVH